MKQIRQNLLQEGEECTLRDQGVLSMSDPVIDHSPSFSQCVKYHLFRPHRAQPGPHHRRKHHAMQAERKGAGGAACSEACRPVGSEKEGGQGTAQTAVQASAHVQA